MKSCNQVRKDISANTVQVSYCTIFCFILFLRVSYLTEHVNQPAIDPASACHNTVTRELFKREHTFKKVRQRIRVVEEEGAARTCSLPWPLPCSCPGPCQNQSSGAPQTCPSPQRSPGPAEAPLAPWLSAYPKVHAFLYIYTKQRCDKLQLHCW